MSEPTQTELELEAIDAAILDILKNGVSEYEIKGRKATKLDLGDLQNLRKELRSRLVREQGKGKNRNVGIRFS